MRAVLAEGDQVRPGRRPRGPFRAGEAPARGRPAGRRRMTRKEQRPRRCDVEAVEGETLHRDPSPSGPADTDLVPMIPIEDELPPRMRLAEILEKDADMAARDGPRRPEEEGPLRRPET